MGILLLAIVLGGIAGWLLRFRRTGTAADDTRIRGLALAPLALACQLAWALWISASTTEPSPWRLLVPLSTAVLGGMLLLNRRWLAARLVLAGLALNLVVMLANGGLMPISPVAAAAVFPTATDLAEGAAIPGSKDMLLRPEHTRLALLDDRLLILAPFGPARVLSIGDVLVMVGIAWWTCELVRRPRQKEH